jgi:outer membrane protein assembly factor BamB
MMRRLVLAGAFLLAACSGPSGPKMAELAQLPSSIPVRTLWQASVGAAGDAILSPAVVAGGVYAAAEDGTVARFDAGNGNEVWRVNAGTEIAGGVGSDGTLVAVGTYDGEVIVLDAGSGKPRWRARVSSEVLSPPVVAKGLVIVRSGDDRVFALETGEGKRRWFYQRTPPVLSVRAPSGMVIDQDNVYAGFAGGKMTSIALANGGVRWEATVSLPHGTTELERVTDVVGAPVIARGAVCAAAYQGRLGCFDERTGNPLWSREMSSTAGPAVDGRMIEVSDDKGTVYALDLLTGSTLWKQDRLFYRGVTAPLPIAAGVAVGDAEGYVHFLSHETGKFIGRTATDGSPIKSVLERMKDGLLVQTQNGNLYALTIQ